MIKENLIPDTPGSQKINFVYSSEADLLDIASLGVTGKQWREENPESGSKMRDHANVHQLVCLANMESLNMHFIEQGSPQPGRLLKQNEITIRQMSILVKSHTSANPGVSE